MRVSFDVIRISCALPFVFVAATAAAHHSPGAYDITAEATIEGTVTEFHWTNPHVYIYVKEDSKDGEAIVWEIEAFAPTIMRQSGWSADTLAAGDHVVALVRPPRKSGSNAAWLASIENSDETLLDREIPESSPAYGDDNSQARTDSLSGVWEGRGGDAVTLLLYLPRTLPLTEKGIQAMDNFQSATMNPGIDCVPFTAPLYMVLPGFKKIEISDDVVLIRGEDADVERVVHMNVASHDGAALMIQGHSIGSWEGDVLVVDTARFASHSLGIGADLASGTGKRIVERFQLAADGSSLTYGFELEDPEYLTAPVTGTSEWVYRPDVEFTPAECDIDSARRFIDD